MPRLVLNRLKGHLREIYKNDINTFIYNNKYCNLVYF